jgi:hypothetical protein
LIVSIIGGIFLLILLVAGGVGYAIHARNPAAFLSDQTLRTRLPGQWTIIQSVPQFGTYQAHLITNGKVSDFGGPYVVQAHYITITITQVRGMPVRTQKQVTFGPIRELSDTKMVLRTKYNNQDETYQRSAP